MKSLLQVIKIKGDEREDLKVLATGVAAALASRKVFLFYLSYSSFALLMTSKFETFVASKVSGFRNILLCKEWGMSIRFQTLKLQRRSWELWLESVF